MSDDSYNLLKGVKTQDDHPAADREEKTLPFDIEDWEMPEDVRLSDYYREAEGVLIKALYEAIRAHARQIDAAQDLVKARTVFKHQIRWVLSPVGGVYNPLVNVALDRLCKITERLTEDVSARAHLINNGEKKHLISLFTIRNINKIWCELLKDTADWNRKPYEKTD